MVDVYFQYLKKRGQLGRQPLFCEQGPDICDSINTNKAEFKNYILRNPVHENIQHTPCYSEHNVNTVRAEYNTTGINHSEGGWPKDVNIYDPEVTQRYRRKVEKEDNYINCIMHLSPPLEHYILQNNAVDMYRTYYCEMKTMPPLERISCRTVNVYNDPHKRPITSICWQPEGGLRFTACYVDVDFYHVSQKPTVCYQWDSENNNAPEVTFTPPSPMYDMQYSPREPTTIIGGLNTGQVAQFDTRIGGNYVSICPPHVAHRELVRSVLFLNTKSGQEFFSGSSDGMLKWWDLRNLSEPTDFMIMDVVQSSFDVQTMGKANGVSVMEYESTIPTRFMVGTDNGLVIGGNRKGKSPLEKLPARFSAHLGPVWSLERNPNFLKNFLTVGDWTAKVWSEDCKESSVIWTPNMRHKITSGTWSPTRLSLMLLASYDGKLALWDLVRSHIEPVITIQISKTPLLKLKFHEAGSLVNIGNSSGQIFMIELSPQLITSEKMDKGLMTALLERESKRERILEARQREIRLKQRQAEEGSPAPSLTELDTTFGDKDLAEATTDYMAQVKKELTLM